MRREDASRRRGFRSLLRLLPFDFRADFGDEIEAAFEEQQREAQQEGGARRSTWLWLRTAVDTVRLAVLEHWDLLRQDVRFGLRTFVRSPGFTAVAILTLALGTGAVTAIFTIVDAVVFRPLPFPDADRLVCLQVVRNQRGGFRGGMPPFSYPQFEDVRDQNTVLTAVAAHAGAGEITLSGTRGTLVTANASSGLFQVLGTQPILGRSLTPGDEEGHGPAPAVITHRAWTTFYGADPHVIGRPLADLPTAEPAIIVGVLPPGFRFPSYDGRFDVDAWLPVTPKVKLPPGAVPRGTSRWSVVGRLRPGVGLETANQQLDAIAKRLAAAYPDTDANNGLRATSFHEHVVGDARSPLLFFFGAVASLLLIACVNVTNLLLARSSAREREFAIRAALGAGRLRVIRQMLTETTLLALAGGIVGLGLAYAGARAFVAFSPNLPRLDEARIDLRVLAFSLGVIVFTSVAAALVPVVRCSRRGVVEALARASGYGSSTPGSWHRPANLLVVTQIALALTLLFAAGLMVNSFAHLIGADLGFDRHAVATADVLGSPSQPQTRSGLTWPAALAEERRTGMVTLSERQRRRAALNEDLVRRVAALPGVESAALGTDTPFPEGRGRNGVRIEGVLDRELARVLAETAAVTPGYFKTLRIGLVAGRLFDDRDREGRPRVAIVSETLARLCWPGKSALGQGIAIGSNPFAHVVGIVRDSLREGPTDEPSPALYYPDAQDPRASKLVLRLPAGVAGLPAGIEREVRGVDPGLRLGQLRVLDDLMWARLIGPRFITSVVTAFSLLALALALIGVHGVLAYSVARRTHEIGIRMALGGSHGRVMRMVLGEATRYALVGGIAGVAGGIATARVARAMLFQVAPDDPLTIVVVSLVLAVTVVLAGYGPAHQATRVDPMACLKQE